MRSPSSSAFAAGWATAVLTSLLVSCGDDGGGPQAIAPPATSTPSTPQTQGPAQPVGVPVPETTPRRAADGETGDFSAPPAASGDALPKVDRTDGLVLRSPQSSELKWTLRAKSANADGDEAFCVSLTTPSVAKPQPSCNSGTLLALQFFSDQADAHALATVTRAPVERRLKPSWLVVSGVAAANVERVRVRHGGKSYTAAMTPTASRIPVDKTLAKELTGATAQQLGRLPDDVTLRAFAVAFPQGSGNPPQDAVAETLEPVNGTLTFALQ